MIAELKMIAIIADRDIVIIKPTNINIKRNDSTFFSENLVLSKIKLSNKGNAMTQKFVDASIFVIITEILGLFGDTVDSKSIPASRNTYKAAEAKTKETINIEVK